MKEETNWLCGILGVFLIALVAGVIFAFSCIPTSEDHQRCNSLLRDVKQHFEFTVMREDGSGPAVYCVGLAYSDHIDVHGEYSDQEVAEIIAAISDAQDRRRGKKPIEVQFFAKDQGGDKPYHEVTIKR